MAVVKINALTVPAEMREDLEKRFANRAGMVDSADGFEWFELLRPLEGTDQYLVYTRWRSEEDYLAWQRGPAFQRGHAQAAEAAKSQGHGHAAATGSQVWTFEVIQSAAPKS
ncbi:antibiotic biosynthesis monooxygenase family protein [Nonomuraea sp. NPDC050790]|uniref:antibiotic biosynthesis monooxygenase family protein n=1 Tax=Nonomuraea sp. NPDC050790 TaxID=3364371 RepID=UPI0037A6A363